MEANLKLQLVDCKCMEVWILQFANCFDNTTKQQKTPKNII
jgi:hypothetical protein